MVFIAREHQLLHRQQIAQFLEHCTPSLTPNTVPIPVHFLFKVSVFFGIQ